VRISELARRTRVPVGTIKYYLREGLLPPGELTSATQAQYQQRHVERLELIRVLLGAGLSVNSVRSVLAAIDDPPASVHKLLGTAHAALGVPPTASPEATERARELVRRWGWAQTEDAPALHQMAAALEAIETAGLTLGEPAIDRYAELMFQVAELDVGSVPVGSPAEAVRYVVAGTVLFEPLLLALRRLAHQQVSSRRFGAEATLTPAETDASAL
jgi:DNA-binding transcriptional MerR regulator